MNGGGASVAESILEVQQLTRRFGARTAVDSVDLYVNAGERYLLAGPAGAGKSTLVALLATLLRPSSGIVNIDGFQLNRENHAIRGRIGVVFSDGMLDDRLTVRENLAARAACYRLRKQEASDAVAQAADRSGITARLGVRYGRLDPADRRRADFARALLTRPALLLLDDPARGLDASDASAVLDLAARLAAETGAAVLQTARTFDRLEGADRIGILSAGRIRAEGTPSELVERFASDRLRLAPRRDADSRAAIVRLLDAEGYRHSDIPSDDGTVLEVAIGNSMGALLLVNRVAGWISRFEMLRGDLGEACVNALDSVGADLGTKGGAVS